MIRLRRILNEHDTAPTELYLALSAFAWGIALLSPWGNFEGSRALRLMAALLSESAWGMIALIVGVLSILALLWQHRHAVMLRCVAAWAQGMFWAYVCGSAWIGTGGATIGGAGLSVTVLATLWVFWRLVRRHTGERVLG